MAVALDVVRSEWEDGYRRFQDLSRDRVAADRLSLQLEVVTDELRKRVGQTYTLRELVAAYGDSELWGREVLEERAQAPGWPRDLTLVLAAAFGAYQRGAVDYEP